MLDVLDHVKFDGGRELVDNAFAFGMIAQHEQQHDETMLATHQLRAGVPVLDAPPPPAGRGWLPPEVLVPGGVFEMGTSIEPWALDNERPAHAVRVAPYVIDTAPVSNGDYLRFVLGGGYDDPQWWSEAGWAHVRKASLVAPRFWELADGEWWRLRFGHRERLPLDEPVMHVCFYEAEAYAKWAGKRLPTEEEWEFAARFDPATGRTRRFPWGDESPGPQHANLGQRHLAAGAGRGVSGRRVAAGCRAADRRRLGVDLERLPRRTRASARCPYDEYSLVFFGPDYKVLRGGSFGTDEVVARGTFRNWDYPIRRQIFAGFRCARDPRPEELHA